MRAALRPGRAWRALDSYQGQAPLSHWLYRITTTSSLKVIRAKGRRPVPTGEIGHLQPYPDRLLDQLTDVLPEVARKAAEDVASLIIAAGCLIPGTTRPRQPEPPDRGGGGRGTGSRAHTGRQVGNPRRADLDINKNRLSGIVPAKRRNAHRWRSRQ